MKQLLSLTLALVMSLTLTACGNNNDTSENSQQVPTGDNSQQERVEYNRELVEFPQNYNKGVNYTTVHRGNVREELYTSREAIEAVQDGQQIPDGTVITLEIYRDEELDEIFVMEKRTGWGNQTPEGTPPNGDWQYQEFNADRSLDYKEDIGRCFSCHANQERDDFVNSMDEMKSFDLKNLTGSKGSSTEFQIASIPTEHWKVTAVDDNMKDPHGGFLEKGLLENEEKAGIVEKVLLTIHFNQET
jgi:hypothetical protein